MTSYLSIRWSDRARFEHPHRAAGRRHLPLRSGEHHARRNLVRLRSDLVLQSRCSKHEHRSMCVRETGRDHLTEKAMFLNSTRMASMAPRRVCDRQRSGLRPGHDAQQDACRPEVFRLCSSSIPDVGEIVACLRDNEPRLSEACHQVMFSEMERAVPAAGTPACRRQSSKTLQKCIRFKPTIS